MARRQTHWPSFALTGACLLALAGCGGGGGGSWIAAAGSPGTGIPSGGDDTTTPTSPVEAEDCASFARFKASVDTVITAAEAIQASPASPWTTPKNLVTPSGLSVNQPFCRITGSIRPTAKSDIGFELWLPLTAASWNGKFLGNAAGGSSGAIYYTYMIDPLKRGYAVMAHDNGHVSAANVFEQESWAYDAASHAVNIERVTDFGYRAQHVVTVVSKEISDAYYSRKPTYSYYNGCSQGGHHGLMEVQRYPEDYDGVVAGAHGGDWLGMMSSEAFAAISVLKDNRAGGLNAAQLGAFHSAVVSACDANDGLVDGQIGDPRKCTFDPAILQCGAPGAATATCMTPAQVQATKDILSGPHRSTGESVSPGYAIGSEAGWSNTWNSTTNLRSGSYFDFFRLILKQDPAFDITSLNFDTDIDAGRAQWGTVYDANSTDLSAFRARNGKLIMYHGWADPLISPFISLNYWNRLQDTMGANSVGSFARLFMVPDMGHCSGGPIGTQDWLTPLENWVEKGIAPDGSSATNTVFGTGVADGKPRKRPICPYPQVARYKGSGDINAPENFSCVAAP